MIPALGGIAGFVASAGGADDPELLVTPEAWYDADALTGADGSDVDSWTDESGNGFHATPNGNSPTLAHNSLNGRQTVLFGDGGFNNRMNVSSSLMSGATAGSAFIVFWRDADPGDGSAMFDRFGSDSTSSHQPFGDGVFYSTFGTTARKTAGNPASVLTSPRIYSEHSAANDWRNYMDGTQLFSTTTNTVNFGTSTRMFGDGGTGASFDGNIAEFLVFDSVLTQTEREKVEGYLAHKWGLTANLPALHPYKSVAP